jgi:hypothetical protein
VARKTLHPEWNEDFRFDVPDDAALQSEPLILRVMDHDTYSAADLIGTCYISLNPLLAQKEQDPSPSSGLAGWFPIYDTLEGIRGELYVAVKVLFVTDENPFSEASAGVRFFSASSVDPGVLAIESVMGFVEELVVDTDPEHETVWADKFRTARSSNEARLLVLYRLSAAVRRLVGKKALEMVRCRPGGGGA